MIKQVSIKPGSKMYLAGGFRSGWQDRVKRSISRIHYYDPREHGIEDPKAYTKQDFEMIEDSDIVFAFMEKSNPAGYALALEIGYAKALGKPVILVDEKSADDCQFRRYWDMCRAASDEVYENLDDALRRLDQLLSQTRG